MNAYQPAKPTQDASVLAAAALIGVLAAVVALLWVAVILL